MQISEVMSREVTVVNAQDSLRRAAVCMAELDVGSLPVQENERLVGMITDRDIVTRAVAEGQDPEKTRVRDVMSAEVMYCFEDDDVEEAARNMAVLQIRRLPVLNRDKRLVGIVALGDVARHHDEGATGETLREISLPPGVTVVTPGAPG